MHTRIPGRRPPKTFLLILSAGLIAFFAYKDVLGYFFTGLDTLNIIQESRFESLGELASLFKRTMTTEFAWYRPMADFFYGLTYLFWKLNPYGYFLTNLILHITASIAVFVFLRTLLPGRLFTAGLAAAIFAVHPIHVENVPALRMNDIIATIFILVSLIFFIMYLNGQPLKRPYIHMAASFFCCALALLTKEISVILPVLVFSLSTILLSSDKVEFKDNVFRSIRLSFPYIGLSILYLILRSSVIGGVGGYTSSFGGGSSGFINLARRLVNINILYVSDLMYPADFLRFDRLFSPFSSDLKQAGFGIILVCIVFFAMVKIKKGSITLFHDTDGPLIRTLLVLSFAFTMISIAGIFIYPVISPYFNRMIQHSYNGSGAAFLSGQMENIGRYHVEFYYYKFRELIVNSLLFVFGVSGLVFLFLRNRAFLKQTLINSFQSRVIAFLFIWLLMPLLIYLATVTFDHHDMYISVVPFSAILAMIFVSAFGVVRKSRAWVSLVVVTGIILSLFAYSPLIRTYGEWQASGEVHRMFLEQLSSIEPDLPPDAVINIYNFPGGITSYKSMIPHAKEVAYMADFSIKAWLDMTYPGNSFKVIMHGKQDIARLPERLDLKVRGDEGNNVNVSIIYDFNKSENNMDNKT